MDRSTSKTVAIHVRCQHNTCNILGCKLLRVACPEAWDQEGFCFQTKTFLMLTGVNKKAIHLSPHTFPHTSNQNQCTSIFMPCTFQQPLHFPFTHTPVYISTHLLNVCTDKWPKSTQDYLHQPGPST